jgi:VanZ family protein
MAWAGFIVGLTSVPGRDVPEVGVPHVDKLVHFLLYAILGFLLARSLRDGTPGARPRLAFRALVPWIACIALYAAADEWHQRWVPGRSADLLDWYADVAGGTVALLLAARPVARAEHLT